MIVLINHIYIKYYREPFQSFKFRISLPEKLIVTQLKNTVGDPLRTLFGFTSFLFLKKEKKM